MLPNGHPQSPKSSAKFDKVDDGVDAFPVEVIDKERAGVSIFKAYSSPKSNGLSINLDAFQVSLRPHLGENPGP